MGTLIYLRINARGQKTLVAPVGGTVYMFDPDGGGIHAINITLPPKTLISGIESTIFVSRRSF